LNNSNRKRKYTLVLIPSESDEQQRSFSISRWKFFLLILTTAVFLGGIVICLMVWTPFGNTFHFDDGSNANETNKLELIALQKDLSDMSQQLAQLTEYNIQMRVMLGQNISREDSLFLIKQRSNPEREEKIVEKVQQNLSSEKELTALGKFSSFTSVSKIEFPINAPIQGLISRYFEPNEGHFGIDITGKKGATIITSAEGFVLFSSWTYDNGNTIIISHANGYLSVYKHLETLFVTPYTNMKRSEIIGTVGNTGTLSNGSHLHFELWKNGIALDPTHYILQKNKENAL